MSLQPDDIFTRRTRELKHWWFDSGSDEDETLEGSSRHSLEKAEGAKDQGRIQPSLHSVYRQLNRTQR
ncbi:hypothetical protein [Marinobacter alexandrii]|jgi:hypothetical protein|uniref:hypothetical protein n=1 Tax=Marinobacter alexandrii TaxID=2570351 RepID=UPI002ABE1A68|nr:hypothetical protein [Marinobacter alexandrii]